jgi:hypothetical protein
MLALYLTGMGPAKIQRKLGLKGAKAPLMSRQAFDEQLWQPLRVAMRNAYLKRLKTDETDQLLAATSILPRSGRPERFKRTSRESSRTVR